MANRINNETHSRSKTVSAKVHCSLTDGCTCLYTCSICMQRTKNISERGVMFMYRDLFPPDSGFIQIQLKQGHASLYNIILAIVLYCPSLLLCYKMLVCFSSFFSSAFRPGLSLRLEVTSASKRGSGQAKCCGLAPFSLPLCRVEWH